MNKRQVIGYEEKKQGLDNEGPLGYGKDVAHSLSQLGCHGGGVEWRSDIHLT